MTTISTDHFTLDAKNKSFTSELSLLMTKDLFGRIYCDACDAGFTLESHKTGAHTVWYHAETKRDVEGELQFFKFKPTAESLRKHPQLKDWTVTVFND